MAFIDDLTFHIKAGDGGAGVVRWRHEKGKELAGAAGGNGGNGGDVYVHAIRDLGILERYRNTKEFSAGKGGDGMRNSMHGKDGTDLIIDLPIGSIVTDKRTNRQYNLLQDDEKILRFVNSNDAPRLAELGTSCPDHFLRTKTRMSV